MNTADIESSLYKYLYENLEVTDGIKVFENVFYLNFDTYNQWVAIDTLTNTAGSLSKALFFLHIAIKEGQTDETRTLNRLVDKVVKVVNQGVRIDIYNDTTSLLCGEMEITQTSLSPVIKHSSGGSYRSMTVGAIYAGASFQN